MGAPRTHSAPAQATAPPSGSQAFSDDQIRQLHSLLDSYMQGSLSGMIINESHFIDLFSMRLARPTQPLYIWKKLFLNLFYF